MTGPTDIIRYIGLKPARLVRSYASETQPLKGDYFNMAASLDIISVSLNQLVRSGVTLVRWSPVGGFRA